MNIKINFKNIKTKLKTIFDSQTDFYSIKHYRMIFKNCS